MLGRKINKGKLSFYKKKKRENLQLPRGDSGGKKDYRDEMTRNAQP